MWKTPHKISKISNIRSHQVIYLVATQANVEQVKVLCAFSGETRPDGQRGHAAQGA